MRKDPALQNLLQLSLLQISPLSSAFRVFTNTKSPEASGGAVLCALGRPFLHHVSGFIYAKLKMSCSGRSRTDTSVSPLLNPCRHGNWLHVPVCLHCSPQGTCEAEGCRSPPRPLSEAEPSPQHLQCSRERPPHRGAAGPGAPGASFRKVRAPPSAPRVLGQPLRLAELPPKLAPCQSLVSKKGLQNPLLVASTKDQDLYPSSATSASLCDVESFPEVAQW